MIGLRQATCQDAVALAALHRLSRAQSMPWLPVLHSQAQNISYFQNRVLAVNTVWTVHQNERLAGFIAYGGGWVNHLYIHPDHWRHGHGQRLLRQAQAEHQPLLLWVFQRNTKAQAFYHQAGFTTVAKTDGQSNEERTPDVKMAWHPAP